MALGLDLLHQVGRRILAEIDAGPARHEDQGAVVAYILLVVLELGLGLGVGLIDDDGHQVVGEQLTGIAPGFGRAAPYVGDIMLQDRLGRRGHEDAFRMVRGEGTAGIGGARPGRERAFAAARVRRGDSPAPRRTGPYAQSHGPVPAGEDPLFAIAHDRASPSCPRTACRALRHTHWRRHSGCCAVPAHAARDSWRRFRDRR